MTEKITRAVAGVTPGWHRLRIVDDVTGEPIEHVREVDAEAGRVTRNKVTEAGNLSINADGEIETFVEERAVRIERIEPKPAAAAEPAGEPAGEGGQG